LRAAVRDAAFVALAHPADIAARAKAAARTGQHHRAHFAIVSRTAKFFEQAGDHLITQCIELVGPIHREVEHAVAAIGDQSRGSLDMAKPPKPGLSRISVVVKLQLLQQGNPVEGGGNGLRAVTVMAEGARVLNIEVTRANPGKVSRFPGRPRLPAADLRISSMKKPGL